MRTGNRRFRLFAHDVIDIGVGFPRLSLRIFAKGIAVPAVGTAGGERAANGNPGARLVGAVHLQIAVGVVLVMIDAHGYIAGGADDDAQDAGLNQARAGRLNDGITAARVAGESCRQTGEGGDLLRDGTRVSGGFNHVREDAHIQSRNLGDQLGRPDAVAGIEKARAGSIRYIHQLLAGHAEADVILGTKEALHAGEVFRLHLAKPEDLAAGIAGEHGVVRVSKQRLATTGLLCDPVALLLGALIAPENGGTNHLVVLIQRNKAVHLS